MAQGFARDQLRVPITRDFLLHPVGHAYALGSPRAVYRDVTRLAIGGVAYAPAADATVTNTVTETDLHTFSFGGPLKAGRVIRLTASGRVTALAAGNVVIRTYLGGTATSATPAGLSAANDPYCVVVTYVVESAGAAATVRRIALQYSNSAAFLSPVFVGDVAFTANLTGTPVIKTTAQWSVANPGDTYLERMFVVEVW